ncbi:MAG TPA: hypothetical protein VEF34_00240, partial [Syntrophobacteraceae bacterium]|nr:hypothetical protein [Syntrophobacteraceae bacterium]
MSINLQPAPSREQGSGTDTWLRSRLGGDKPLHLNPTWGRGSAALYALPITSILNAIIHDAPPHPRSMKMAIFYVTW